MKENILHASVIRAEDDRDELEQEPASVRIEVMEDAITKFLVACGVDTSDPHVLETPARVARAFSRELLGGYQVSIEDLFKSFAEAKDGPVVVVRDIPVYSLCAHHMLPFYGTASIAYQPNGRIVGLSKIARVVDCLARRLQVQERLTRQIAEAIQTYLEPSGVAVLVRAEHLCMSMRGISKPKTETVTYLTSGDFKVDAVLGAQILGLLKEP